MLILELLKDIKIVKSNFDKTLDIESLVCNVDSVVDDSLFFCFSGTNIDSHELVGEAESKGAVLFVCEKEIQAKNYIIVKNARKAMSIIARNFYKTNESDIKIIGIVGTNGKTTTAHMVQSILNHSSDVCGIIGTCGASYKGESFTTNMTTPDPITLHYCINKMASNGAKYIALEVSAHSIYLNKLDGIMCDVCIYTNFSTDHLDFFKTLAKYEKAKTSYFNKKYIKHAVINIDDRVGKKLNKGCGVKSDSYSSLVPCDLLAINTFVTTSGSEFVLSYQGKMHTINLHIPGEYNISNALGAIGASLHLGIGIDDIAKGLYNLKSVEGRFNIFSTKQGASVIVDYAHTPDGLTSIIEQARKLTDRKVITVFGCGGNRDKTKRSLMGEIATTLSDLTIITSDNPRYENPVEIMGDISKGANSEDYYVMIESREEAIKYAIEFCGDEDIVLILGKGHEDYQEIKGVKHKMSDIEMVKKYI